jgi:hypothetical protein
MGPSSYGSAGRRVSGGGEDGALDVEAEAEDENEVEVDDVEGRA